MVRLRLLLIGIAVVLAAVEVRPSAAPSAEAQTPGENGKIAYELNGRIAVITPRPAGHVVLWTGLRAKGWVQ
jgi:hypothetical protein